MSILLSAILLVLSFPNFNLEILAWIWLVPLLFAIEDSKPFRSFLIAYAAGALFFFGSVYWLIHVTLPGMIAVVLYLSLYFGLFGLFSYHALRKGKLTALFLIPSIWVTSELARSRLLTGFGWNLLGYSQSYNLPIIQIADITGVYGVSFLIVMVNVAIFFTIKELRNKSYNLSYLIIAACLVFLFLFYGIFRLNNIFTGEVLRVAVIQGNIPQVKKWDSGFKDQILNKYELLTKTAASGKIDLIIWPETSVPGFVESEKDLLDRMTSLAKSVSTPILAGTPREDRKFKDRYYNSAVLFYSDGKITGRYDKIHLVPFGEYIPFRGAFSFVEKFSTMPIGDFSRGRDYTVFGYFVKRSAKDKDISLKLIKKVRFSCLICFEDIFGDLTREFVKRGAVFLVNITNDAWFGKSSAAYQHAQNSVFRAVENRVNVVRAANTGLSCFIDQKGRIESAVEAGGENLFIDGFNIHDIILNNTRTFYTVYGDLFAYICALFSLFMIGQSIVVRK